MSMKRWAAAPFRILLGLPPFYGLTVKCWVLYWLRKVKLYRGTIDFVCMVPPIQIFTTGKDI